MARGHDVHEHRAPLPPLLVNTYHAQVATRPGPALEDSRSLGALAGAVASGMVPGVKPLLPGNMLVTFLFAAVAGAATGGVAGALLSMAASGDRALYYEQEVESGRVLISVTGPRLEEAEVVMREAGAMEAAPVEAPIEKGKARPESG